jgi:hypothetical protein
VIFPTKPPKAAHVGGSRRNPQRAVSKDAAAPTPAMRISRASHDERSGPARLRRDNGLERQRCMRAGTQPAALRHSLPLPLPLPLPLSLSLPLSLARSLTRSLPLSLSFFLVPYWDHHREHGPDSQEQRRGAGARANHVRPRSERRLCRARACVCVCIHTYHIRRRIRRMYGLTTS